MSSYFPRTIAQWVGAVVATAVGLAAVFVVGAFLVAWSGLYDVSVRAGHFPGVTSFLRFARLNSIEQHAEESPEPPRDFVDQVSLERAAGHFAGNCMFCHGGPGFTQSATVNGMIPAPPPLTEAAEKFDDKELFWMVANGFKFSGMPEWPAPGRSDEVWDMVALLNQLPELSKEDFTELAYGPVAGERGKTQGQEQGTGQGGETASGRQGGGQQGGGQQSGGPQGGTQQASAESVGKMGHGLAIMTMTANRAAGLEEIRLVANCARCHGTDGRGRSSGAFPILGLQSETYLKASLDAYASGQRHSGYMASVASQLSPEERIALAEHFAGQPTQVDQKIEVDEATLERGRQIAMEGIELEEGQELSLPREMIEAEEGVLPACTSCHADMPGKDRPLVPRLAGQYKKYLVRQLETWKFRNRGEGTREGYVMQNVAHALPAEDIEAVAAWWASRSEPVDYSEREVDDKIGQ